MTTFEDLLEQDGHIVYKTRGVSMQPMLKQDRDLVIISVPSSRLKNYDVALYKREDNYVLHRVIGVEADHYRIRGDNTYSIEIVPDESVIGVLTGFQRKGKEYDVTDKGYQLYARFWNLIYPLRLGYIKFRRFGINVARKLGILPFLKRILKR